MAHSRHAVFDIVEGTYKKSDADAKAEAELAKTNTKAIYAAIKAVSEAGGGPVVVPAADGPGILYRTDSSGRQRQSVH